MPDEEPLKTYLFCFGYESPEERRSNARDGTDFESSNAVWIEAKSTEEAIRAGLGFAEAWVGSLFRDAGVGDYPGWRESNFAYWIEPNPLAKWSGLALDSLERIRARAWRGSPG